MNMYTVIAVMISLIWAYLGFLTFLNNHRDRINIIFSLLCSAMLLWNFSGGLAYSISDIDKFIVFSKLSFAGFFLFFPLNIHFYLAVSKTSIRPAYLFLIYLPAVVLTISCFITYFLFKDITRYNNEWTGIINYRNVWVYLCIIFLVLNSVISFIILLKWNKRTQIKKEKIYSNFILIFFNSANAVTLTVIFILPVFNIHNLQFAGFALFNLYVLCLFFLVSKFRFMNLVNPLMADEIISSMNDLVFILDKNFKITGENKKNGTFISNSSDKHRNTDFFDIIKENNDIRTRLGELAEGKTGNFMLPVNYKIDSGYLLTNSYFSKIEDRFGDHSGFLVMSNELRDIKQFRENFKITERELEIIEHIITGLSYVEISKTLSISERTVERHLTNIYNKLGINNKIELYRLAGEYNIKL